jgi:hypothetical protein
MAVQLTAAAMAEKIRISTANSPNNVAGCGSAFPTFSTPFRNLSKSFPRKALNFVTAIETGINS